MPDSLRQIQLDDVAYVLTTSANGSRFHSYWECCKCGEAGYCLTHPTKEQGDFAETKAKIHHRDNHSV